MSKFKAETEELKLSLVPSDELSKPSTHTHPPSLAPNHALTLVPACDITVPVTSPASGLKHHCLPITRTQCPLTTFRMWSHWPGTASTRSLCPPGSASRGHGEQGAIKRHGHTCWFACACKQLIYCLPACEREQESTHMSPEQCGKLWWSQSKHSVWFGGSALSHINSQSAVTLNNPFSTLTYSVLRLVHPVVVVLILVSVCRIKMSVRLRVCIAVVNHIELVLAVEDASPTAGEGGHAEPAKSPGKARRLLLVKGSGSPVSPHLHSGK